MIKYSVCLLDDKIPAKEFQDEMEDTKLLNRNNFGCMLGKEEAWEEETLFRLSKDLYEKEDEYEISGFTHHALFFNHIDENIFSPDIVIFDWDVGDMGSSETDPKENLLKLLRSKYCLVAIYTGADNTDVVEDFLEEEILKDYRERLFMIKKDNDNSVEALKNEIDSRLELFSFKLGKSLKALMLQSIDNILINMGKLSFEQFASLFGTRNENGNMGLSNTEFADIFLEKLKYEFNSSDLEDTQIEAPNRNIDDENLMRKIWHFRLYHKSNDEVIRKGDIIRKVDGDELFLVLSSDCHLNYFWKKNLGYLALVPLHLIAETSENFRRRINYCKASNITSYNLQSLVSPSLVVTVLPGLICNNENQYLDYALNPRELTSREVELGVDDRGKEKTPSRKLTVEDIPGYKKEIAISEPFMSALFQYIIQNFSGFGLPDFSEGLRESVKAKFGTLKITKP